MRIATLRLQTLNRRCHLINKTGVKGVTLYNNQYIVRWVNEECYPDREAFSISLYGKEEAFRLAVVYRKKIEETLAHYKEVLCK